MIRFLSACISIHTLTFFLCLPSKAQDKKVFTVEAFIQQVKRYHPIAKQAGLVTEKAEAGLLAARGGFDPLFEAAVNSKSLEGVDYYRYSNTKLKIPTVTGINLEAGYENSSGQFINPELTNGVASFMGMEIPLLNGLLTDKKRTVLQQAKIFLGQSEQERLSMINDLLLNAYGAYWEWTGAYQACQVYNNYLDVADKRAKLVAIGFQNGDRAMADTIEAFAQLQNYKLLQSAALMELNKKTLDLSFYLWSEKEEPYLVPPGYIPDTAQFFQSLVLLDTSQLIGQAPFIHPALQAGQFNIRILEAERRLKLQNLLPKVNLRGNILSKDYFQYKDLSGLYLENNYKWGINVQVPLLLRQARGEYKNSKLKIREAALELAGKTWQIQNKIRKYAFELAQLQKQLQTAYEMSKAYLALLKREELMFLQGESSLFLVNARENKMLEMQLKIIELRKKYLEANNAIQWASGLNR